MFALALAAAAAQPQPGELKTFGNWTVGCDNTRACQAVALVPEAEDRDRYLLLVITRDGAPSASAQLSYSTGASGLANGAALRIDGKRVGSADVPQPLTRMLASALANGKRAALTDARGRTLASVSLDGLAATFLYMDERQRRLGTVGALRRAGRKPDSAVALPPPLPRVVQPRPGSMPARALPTAAAVKLIGPENATCDYAQSPVRPRAFRLDARRSLALVEHPCGNGAYNIFSSVFVLDDAGRPTPAAFDAPVGMSPDGSGPLVNVDWDQQRRRLETFAKGRGLGDCGVRQSFAWNGRRFRLVEQAQMGECRGSTDYITTWRAAVTTAR